MTSMTDYWHGVDLPARPLSTVAKVIGILDAVSRANGPIGVRELARASGIDRSAVSRIATALRSLGVLAMTDDGSCSPGPELWALADRLRRASSIEAESARVVDLLRDATGETAIAVVDDQEGQKVAHVALGRGPVTVVSATGAASPFSGRGSTVDGADADLSVSVALDGAVYLGWRVGLDERGRPWWLGVAIPDQRAIPKNLEPAMSALQAAAIDLRRVTTPVVAR
jgi:hypothetical protein